jgi:hypothetical protein
MSDFRHVIEINVSPARVWPVLLDVERWPEWTTSVTRVQRMDIGPLTLGSRTRIWQPKLMPAVWQVTSLDEQRRVFGWTSRALGVKCVAWHTLGVPHPCAARVGNHGPRTADQPFYTATTFFASIALIPRIACRVRSSFSISENLTCPSP